MRKIITLLSLFLFAGTIHVKAQDAACKKFKNGTFVSTYEGTTITIKRNGNLQEEYLEDAKTPTMAFDIKWIDDCTYVLAYDEKARKEYPFIPKDGKLTVKILKTEGNSYTYSCSSNFSDQVITGVITKIK